MENRKMKKIIFTFFLFLFSVSLHAHLIIDDAGSYQLMRSGDEVALVHTNPTGEQTMRVLPPTLFPLTAVIQSGSVTNQDIIQNLVTIAADNVLFNINGFNLAQGLVVRGSNVTVRNGLIDPTALQTEPFDATAFYIDTGINILPGSADVSIENITVRNATSGILFNQVSGGIVSNCEILLSSTGLELNQSNNIVIDNTVAKECAQIGFNLVSSYTNCVRDCSVLAIGKNNDRILSNNVFGFVSANGYGNIFERCIANSTQALSTTDSNSVVAGFALRGIEKCSKIIECESANATTSVDGVTVPYGILLEATFDGLTAVTSVNPGDAEDNEEVHTVAWSPDGNILQWVGVLTVSQVAMIFISIILIEYCEHCSRLIQ